MGKIILKIEGEFTNQGELEKYLKAVLDNVKVANEFNIPFKAFYGSDDNGNKISSSAIHEDK